MEHTVEAFTEVTAPALDTSPDVTTAAPPQAAIRIATEDPASPPKVQLISQNDSRPIAAVETGSSHVVRDLFDQEFQEYTSPCDIGTKDDLELWTSSVRAATECALQEVIGLEAPIEIDRLARLVARRFGLVRVRQGRLERVKTLVAPEQRRRGPFGEFVWSPDVSPDTWRAFRRSRPGSDRTLEEIAPEEIRNAMIYLARKGMSISESGVLEELAQVFDIRRMSSGMKDRLLGILEWAVARGDLQRTGGRLIARDE
jgi:hypothetical protein